MFYIMLYYNVQQLAHEEYIEFLHDYFYSISVYLNDEQQYCIHRLASLRITHNNYNFSLVCYPNLYLYFIRLVNC